MAPSSITIKIDFGSENAADTKNSVSLNGGVPTPFSSGEFFSSASGQSTEALPKPSAITAQSLEQIDSAAPKPSSSLVPAGSMVAANNVALQGDVPTPFSSGGFSLATIGELAQAVPTPLDNPAHSMGSTGDQAPTPDWRAAGHADLTALAPPQEEEGAGKKSKK